MRRGFLLDKPKKERANPQAQAPAPVETKSVQSKSITADSQDGETEDTSLATDVGSTRWKRLQYGKLDNATITTNFKPNWDITIDAARGIVKSDRKTLILVTVPPKGSKMAANENDYSEWITIEPTKQRIFDTPGFPKPVPKPTGRLPAYEVKMTPNMGMGVFATRDIKHGQLVFAERPLLVSPMNINALELELPDGSGRSGSVLLMNEYEKVLDAAVSRMSPANQSAFRALMNSHTEDGSGPLLGVGRTNGYSVSAISDDPVTKAGDSTRRYSVVGEVASRINHNCMANVHRNFDLAAFSLTFYASRDIKAGEQIFYSYCETEASVSARQRKLAPYGIVCACRGCTTATPERDRFREEYEKRTNEYGALNLPAYQGHNPTWPSAEEFNQLLKFKAMAIEEGLDNRPAYQHVLGALGLRYSKDGVQSKVMETYGLLEKNAAIFAKR